MQTLVVSESWLPFLAVMSPVIGAGLVAVTGRRPNVRESCTLLTCVVTIAVVVAMLPGTLDGEYARTELIALLPDAPLALRADSAGMIFALLASLLWLATSVYSIGYMRSLAEHGQTRFYVAFALSVASAIGVALAENLVTFVLFYELLTIATYPLVTHHETPAALSAGASTWHTRFQAASRLLQLLRGFTSLVQIRRSSREDSWRVSTSVRVRSGVFSGSCASAWVSRQLSCRSTVGCRRRWSLLRLSARCFTPWPWLRPVLLGSYAWSASCLGPIS